MGTRNVITAFVAAIALLNFVVFSPVFAATDVKNDANLSTSLKSFWLLNEASGTTRVDSHGSNDMSDTGTVGQTSGVSGFAADFEDSIPSYLSNSSTDYTETGDWSVSFWINPESLTTNHYVFNRNDAGLPLDMAIWVTSTGIITGEFRNPSNAKTTYTSSVTLSTATWTHVVVTADISAATIKIYVNGSEDTSASAVSTSATTMDQNHTTINIGQNQSGGNTYDGALHDAGLWTKILTSSEVTDLYNSGARLPYEAAGGGGAVPRTHVASFF